MSKLQNFRPDFHGCRFEDMLARVGDWIELDLDEDAQKLTSAKIDRSLAVQTTTSLVEKRSRPQALSNWMICFLDDLLRHCYYTCLLRKVQAYLNRSGKTHIDHCINEEFIVL